MVRGLLMVIVLALAGLGFVDYVHSRPATQPTCDPDVGCAAVPATTTSPSASSSAPVIPVRKEWKVVRGEPTKRTVHTYDDENIYLTVITSTRLTKVTTTQWSDGTTTRASRRLRPVRRSKTRVTPIFDWDHPIRVPTTSAPIPHVPIVAGTASTETGGCGSGGSVETC